MEAINKSKNIFRALRFLTGLVLMLTLFELIPFVFGSIIVLVSAVISIGYIISICIKKNEWEHIVEVMSHALFIAIIFLSAKHF